VLEERAAPYISRPTGRPPREGYEKIVELGPHQAESWEHPQRLVLVVVDRPDKRNILVAINDYGKANRPTTDRQRLIKKGAHIGAQWCRKWCRTARIRWVTVCTELH